MNATSPTFAEPAAAHTYGITPARRRPSEPRIVDHVRRARALTLRALDAMADGDRELVFPCIEAADLELEAALQDAA